MAHTVPYDQHILAPESHHSFTSAKSENTKHSFGLNMFQLLYMLVCSATHRLCSVQATPSVINKSQLDDKQGEPNVINVRQARTNENSDKFLKQKQLGVVEIGVTTIYAVPYG